MHNKTINSVDKNKRDFLITAAKTTLGSALAFSFGNAIAAALTDKRARIGLIYASRYGATADNAAWIAEGIGRGVALLDIETVDIAAVIDRHDRFIVGSGIWREGVHEAIRSLMARHAAVFDDKLIASFVVCGTQPNNDENRTRIAGYFDGIHAPLKQPPALTQALGGRLRVASLTEQDRALLTRFYRNVLKTELVDWDRTDPNTARTFGQQVRTDRITPAQTRPVSGAV